MSRRNPGRRSRNEYGQPSVPSPMQQNVSAVPPFVMRKTSTTHRYLFMPGFAPELRHLIYDYHLLAHDYKCDKITIAPGKGIKYPCKSPLLRVSKEMAGDVKVRVRANALTQAPIVQAWVVNFNFRTMINLFGKQMRYVDFTAFDDVRRKLTVSIRIDNIHYEDDLLAKWVNLVDGIRSRLGQRALKINYEVEHVPGGRRRAEFVEKMNELGLTFAQPGGEWEGLLGAFAEWWVHGQLDLGGDAGFDG
ncbi:hypothetical protein LTR85_003641 [Meristemomyces frigidus]|nr:hypothetical protein LTR85_003641 [Meristemomyces frigidus]